MGNLHQKSKKITISAESPRILYRARHYVVAYKPARLLTVGDSSGDRHLLDWVKGIQNSYLEERAGLQEPMSSGAKGSNRAFVVPVHFLDRPVSGAVLFALSTKGASRLSAQFRERQIEKRYLAILEDQGSPQKGGAFERVSSDPWEVWIDDLVKNPQTNTVQVLNRSSHKASQGDRLRSQRCELFVREIRRCKGMPGLIGGDQETACGRQVIYRLVEIKLGTGRSHQIRVQCAHRGFPLIGDYKYGAKTGLTGKTLHGSIGLHAFSLGFKEPVGENEVIVFAPLPPLWVSLFGKDFFEGYGFDMTPIVGPNQIKNYFS